MGQAVGKPMLVGEGLSPLLNTSDFLLAFS